jgi:tetratricopeptide (TPR) repeat protein
LVGDAVSEVTLEDLLRLSTLNFSQSSKLKLCLRVPWCWPADPELARLAREHDISPPPSRVGETCLVSILDDDATLWLVSPHPDVIRDPRAELVGSAAFAAETAWNLALRDLPELQTFIPAAQRPPWRTLELETTGPLLPEFLDGNSLGLALFLASASMLINQPLPASQMALGAVSLKGEVEPVGGLREKLKVITACALGVTELLVETDQKPEVEELLDALGSKISVTPVAHLSDAVHAAFPELEREGFGGWRTKEAALETLRKLYQRVLGGPGLLLGWKAIAATAEKLEQVLDGDDEEVWKAGFIRSVSLRNEGRYDQIIPWPSDEELRTFPIPIRLRIVAQALQSSTEGCAPDLQAQASRAQGYIAPKLDRYEQDLVLLGAVGRALAAAGDFDEAIRTLREAIQGWSDIYKDDQTSFPLSELVRVLGMLGRKQELDQVLETFVNNFEAAHTDNPHSQAFVDFSVGRALIQCGRPKEGVARLDERRQAWDQAYSHLQRSRLRWLARGREELGDEAGAATARRMLSPQNDGYAILANIDRALVTGDDPRALLEELDRENGPELRRIIGQNTPLDQTTAKLVAEG